jgi:hypothetical protein
MENFKGKTGGKEYLIPLTAEHHYQEKGFLDYNNI